VGLIKHLVLLPIAPVRFTVWVAEKVAEEVEREQASPEAHMRKLREIEEKRERGEVTEEEAAEAEAEIIAAETEPVSGDQEEEPQSG
jgi:hypothetical protein